MKGAVVFEFETTTTHQAFEQSAVGIMHRIWFPDVSYNKVKALQKPVSWDWYKSNVTFDFEAPDLTFAKTEFAWRINLHSLLVKPIESTVIMDLWKAQPSDGLVFPVVGSFGIIHAVSTPPLNECVVKFLKNGQMVVLESLKTYAERFHPQGFEFVGE